MFSLWFKCAQTLGLGLYNSGELCPVSTETGSLKTLGSYLYKLSPSVVLHRIHGNIHKTTGVLTYLYPQSTEPITTTTLYKGGRI